MYEFRTLGSGLSRACAGARRSLGMHNDYRCGSPARARAREVGKDIFARMLQGFDAKEIAAFEDYLRRCITALGGVDPAAASASDRRGETTRLRDVVPRQRRQNAGVSSTRNV